MVRILLIILIFFTFHSKSFSTNEVVKFDNLVQRNKLFYKKFSNEPFTGRVSDKTYEGYIQNGNVEGKWIEYHENGKPKIIGNWRNGLGNGDFFWYSDYGYKTEKRTFSNGKLVGYIETFWKPSGKLKDKRPIKNGKVHGNSLTFHPNGNLWSEKEYVVGKQHGVQRDYFENGELEQIMNFSKGKLHGSYKVWYENRQLRKMGSYKNGKRHGEIKFFDEEGKIIQDDLYKDGKKVNE